tara:strand:- start:143 stop:610 length:468 start_codon:yes stop_codon:yes gene_type:complete
MPGNAWQGCAGQREVRHGKAMLGSAGPGKARYGFSYEFNEAWLGQVRPGLARYGMASHGKVRFFHYKFIGPWLGRARHRQAGLGEALPGRASQRKARQGTVLSCTTFWARPRRVWQGKVRQGGARLGAAMRGKARQGEDSLMQIQQTGRGTARLG